ncbi:MAG: HAD family hydrolase [Candidatus Brocadiaceae bacterium]|uniref:HAD family hydrolase n=1 Tax=Candidatus Wunengus sp. YC61 TaxID=3367698 RepID=UPI00271FA181|nr:HAD family hydrolase [Candidatus Brocadiaceae bacterium]
MHFKAILFDLDGTLLDTLEDLGNAANRVLEKYGFPTHTMADYRYFVGDGVVTLMNRALPEDKRNNDTIQICVKTFREEYGKSWNVKTRPYDGVPEMLDALVTHGLKMAVLSNKPDEFTKLCVTEFLPRWAFGMVIGQHNSLPLKPDPSGALEIAKCLDVPSSHFIYLGDTAIDMKTAVAAGMFPVGALWGFRTGKELLESGARALIKRPQEILTLLDLTHRNFKPSVPPP